MIDEARQYLASRKIARREPLYSANRFARAVGDLPASEVTFQHLNMMRMHFTGTLSNRTIESTVADLLTVIAFVTGQAPAKGDPLKIEPPDPRPIGLDIIEKTWGHCTPHIQAYIAFAYWTALRLSDCIKWLRLLSDETQTISIAASKTGKRHRFPYPPWLQRLVSAQAFPYQATDFGRKSIRREIASACVAANVPVWTPKHLRQRGITEWSRANAAAGALVHGTGMSSGILKHYIDHMSLLESAAPRVRIPSCFGSSTTATTEDTLIHHFRRLDLAAQGLIAGTAERLAAG
jgi:integrase